MKSELYENKMCQMMYDNSVSELFVIFVLHSYCALQKKIFLKAFLNLKQILN